MRTNQLGQHAGIANHEGKSRLWVRHHIRPISQLYRKAAVSILCRKLMKIPRRDVFAEMPLHGLDNGSNHFDAPQSAIATQEFRYDFDGAGWYSLRSATGNLKAESKQSKRYACSDQTRKNLWN